MLDIFDNTSTLVIYEVQQAKGAGAAVAQHDFRQRNAHDITIGSQRCGVDTMCDKLSEKVPCIDNRLAGADGSGGIHRVCSITH